MSDLVGTSNCCFSHAKAQIQTFDANATKITAPIIAKAEPVKEVRGVVNENSLYM